MPNPSTGPPLPSIRRKTFDHKAQNRPKSTMGRAINQPKGGSKNGDKTRVLSRKRETLINKSGKRKRKIVMPTV